MSKVQENTHTHTNLKHIVWSTATTPHTFTLYVAMANSNKPLLNGKAKTRSKASLTGKARIKSKAPLTGKAKINSKASLTSKAKIK